MFWICGMELKWPILIRCCLSMLQLIVAKHKQNKGFYWVSMWFQIDMGTYLSTPKTEKFSEDGENDRLRYGLSSMQGWRATMEDAVSKYLLLHFASMM